MKKKLVIALVVVLFLVEWIILKQSTPATSAVPNESSAPRAAANSSRPAKSPRSGSPKGNALARIAPMTENGEPPRMTDAQVEPYLAANKRNAESLLAAFATTRNEAYLREAKEKFPRDPRVDLVAATRSDSPAERRQWLDLLKQTAPDNALGNYLSANDYFKSGQTSLALQELANAAGKNGLNDYTRDFTQSAQEAWQSAGFSAAEAMPLAGNVDTMYADMQSSLVQYKQIGNSLTNLVAGYRQAGDDASAQAALQMGLSLGQRLDDPAASRLIQPLVGLALQYQMLSQLDPASAYGDTGLTIQNQLDAIKQRGRDFKSFAQQGQQLLPSLSDEDLVSYFDRVKISGEANASRWLVNKYGPAQ